MRQLCADAAVIAASGYTAATLHRNWLRSGSVDSETGGVVLASLIAGFLGYQLLRRSPAYTAAAIARPLRHLGSLACGLAAGIAGGAAVLAMLSWPLHAALGWLPIWALIGTAGLVLSRIGGIWLAGHGKLAERVAIVGVNEHSESLIRWIRSDANGAVEIVGLYDDRVTRIPGMQFDVPLRGNLNDLLSEGRLTRIDKVVIALPIAAQQRIAQIRQQLAEMVAGIHLTADAAGLHYRSEHFGAIGGSPVVTLAQPPLGDWQRTQKAVFDRLMALLLLLMLSPFMVAIALLIRLDSRGPVLFRQTRVGFNNVPFELYKFRTMHHHLEDRDASRQTVADDDRVTRVGRILRRLSVDELPQLLNVLRGDMSLVGPRPHALNTRANDQALDEAVSHYAARHRVKPGITGWAQVNGSRGALHTVEDVERRVALDLEYIENWSLSFDLRIMLLTILREIVSKRAF